MGNLMALLGETEDRHDTIRIRKVLTANDVTSLISSQKEQARGRV